MRGLQDEDTSKDLTVSITASDGELQRFMTFAWYMLDFSATSMELQLLLDYPE